MKLYDEMQHTCIKPDRSTLLCMVKTCANSATLEHGRQVHEQIIINELDSDVVVGSALVDMYAKCGSLEEARCVFDRLPTRTVVSWGAMIAGNVQHGHGLIAVELFDRLQLEGIKPDKLLFSFVLKACVNTGAIVKGRIAHCQLLGSKLGLDVVVENTLIDLYVKWGTFDEAGKVFHKLPFRTVVSWSAMIAGCAHPEDGHLALEFFEKMQEEGIMPDRVTFLCTLKACSSIGAIKQGRLLHGWMVECGLELDVASGSTLVDMYAKCASLEEAHKVFSIVRIKTVVLWSALIGGYAEHGCGFTALELLNNMQEEGIEPDEVTLLCILKACGSAGSLRHGLLMHYRIISMGLVSNIAISNNLVDMYSKCGSLEDAWQVFGNLVNRTVVSWGAMISGYARQGRGLHALILFEKMQQEGIKSNQVTFISVLRACGSSQSTQQGLITHNEIVKNGFESDVVVGSSLIDMYAKCGTVKEAEQIFGYMPCKNIISWGAMIAGYAQHGHEAPALNLFGKMLQEGMKPSRVTILCCLIACGSIGSVSKGRLVHDQIIRGGLKLDVVVGNALLNMYVKCGSLGEAHQVLDTMLDKDMITWGSMIAGYVCNGNHGMARQCFENMLRLGLTPNHVIYTLILATCSHSGLLEEGHQYFESARDHGVVHSVQHYSCIADLLARTGHMKEAKDLLQSMPCCPDFVMWMSLLTGCRTYGNRDLGKLCFELLYGLDCNQASGYMLMSKIYTDAQLWDDANRIKELRKNACAKRKPGRAWIDIENMVQEFIVRDQNHPQCDEIGMKLKRASRQVKEEGFLPCVDSVAELTLYDVEEEAIPRQCGKHVIAPGLGIASQDTVALVANSASMCTVSDKTVKIISDFKECKFVLNDVHVYHG